jgi:hypothetical protein
MQVPEWEVPSFEAIRMDAEIGSYQNEFDEREREPLAASRTRLQPNLNPAEDDAG